jgi:hypothetical protein
MMHGNVNVKCYVNTLIQYVGKLLDLTMKLFCQSQPCTKSKVIHAKRVNVSNFSFINKRIYV